MAKQGFFDDPPEVAADLALLEKMRQSRNDFVWDICGKSASHDEAVLATLRLESTYQFAEFYYLLHAHHIDGEEDIRRLAELHNQYIVDLMKDDTKMSRLGLTSARLLDAMFTADTMPRLLQNWRERPGAIDQSNLARFLVSVMSTETCRKVVMACTDAGFLAREKTPYGTVLVSSKGIIEAAFANSIRALRRQIGGGK
jgi:hypothetical protein